MAPRIFCLHTAEVHVATFGRLFASSAPGSTVEHALRPDWLAAARRDGLDGTLGRDIGRALDTAAKAHDAVLCTCSTLGPIVAEAAARHANIVRIDQPLMDAAASHDGVIIVAFAVESTRAPTLALLETALRRAGRRPDIDAVYCEGAWPAFERGDDDAFASAIATRVRAAAARHPDLGCVVLAQASMAVAEPRLADLGVPVLSSPRLAVVETLRRCQDASARTDRSHRT